MSERTKKKKKKKKKKEEKKRRRRGEKGGEIDAAAAAAAAGEEGWPPAEASNNFCLLVTFVLGLSLSGCLGSYVPCEPCDDKAMSMCPPVPVGCQLVKEPGCGCCLTCALSEGQACGVYTGTCAQGLRCLPRSGEEKPLHALLHGRGVCTNEKGHKAAHPPIGKMLHARLRPGVVGGDGG
ncbi:hypothetical protein CRUP_034750, partial [Coryphaenoides rupestris]